MTMQRRTIQKSLIKEALEVLSHPSAEDIYHYVHDRYPSIGKATLYRNLKAMSEEGSIRKVNLSDGSAGRFDECFEPHFHGECRECGTLCDIQMDSAYAEELKAKISETGGFLIEDQEVIFKGLCPKCIRKMEEQNERS